MPASTSAKLDAGELLPEGNFAFYDLTARPGTPLLTLREVTSGTHRPVLIEEDIAVVTDTNFLFQPIIREGLVFLQRRFQRIAKTRGEIPRLVEPES